MVVYPTTADNYFAPKTATHPTPHLRIEPVTAIRLSNALVLKSHRAPSRGVLDPCAFTPLVCDGLEFDFTDMADAE